MPIKISQNFDGGAIEVVRAEHPSDIELFIRNDSHAQLAQWFYFRMQGAIGQACEIRFLNAGNCLYPGGWAAYQAVASYDRKNWFRVNTSYDGQVMTVRHTPERNSVYCAYFEPYSWEQHLNLLARADGSDRAHVDDLGSTVDGRDINVVIVGDPAARMKVWVIARQHPGETMAEWFVEGMLDALLDHANPLSRCLLDEAVFYVIPNMNPDGSVRGNLRTNAAGLNLNREWASPNPELCPEVFLVRNKIHEVGCDIFLDIHGDEALPYVFVAGSEMLENFSLQQQEQQSSFIANYKLSSPDFQDVIGYPAGKYNQDMLKLASKYIGHTFQCLSLTLEMPFKDNANMPDARTGWNGARSARLGAASLLPIWQAIKGKDNGH